MYLLMYIYFSSVIKVYNKYKFDVILALYRQGNLQKIAGAGDALPDQQQCRKHIGGDMQAAQAQITQNLRQGTVRKQHQAHHSDARPTMGLPERWRQRVIRQSQNLRLSSQAKNTRSGDQSKRRRQARCLRNPQCAKTERGSEQQRASARDHCGRTPPSEVVWQSSIAEIVPASPVAPRSR